MIVSGIESTIVHWSPMLLLLCFISIGLCIIEIILNNMKNQTFTKPNQVQEQGGIE